MQWVKQVQRKHKESEIRMRSVLFTDGQKWLCFCRRVCCNHSFSFTELRRQNLRFNFLLVREPFYYYMYSQFMLTIFRKIYRLLQPTYLATSSQRGLSSVSSLSLVNFCRKIQEISFHSPKAFLPKLQTTSAPSCFELCRGGREPMKPVFLASRLHLRFRFPSSYV